jgi:hypothetical protein
MRMSVGQRPRPWVVFGCGATIETAFLPQRLFDLRSDFEIRVGTALSERAMDFVTLLTMQAICGDGLVYHRDNQLSHDGTPLHIVLRAIDLLVLYPATPRIIAECALGIIRCPVTRSFAFLDKDRILVAPTLHPAVDHRLYEPHLLRLMSLGCELVDNANRFVSWYEVRARVLARLSPAMRSPTEPIAMLPTD